MYMYMYMCIQSLRTFRRAKIVQSGQHMGYKFSENVFQKILEEALGSPKEVLGRSREGSGRYLVVPGSAA